MELWIHSLELQMYHLNETNKYNTTFINKVSENMRELSTREIKGSDMARKLYAKVLYPSNTDFRWMIQNNHINDCDKMVIDIDVLQEIWFGDIDALKGKTTWTKPNLVIGI